MNDSALKTLLIRTLSGAVLVVVVVAAVLASRYSFAALLLVICIGAMREFYKLSTLRGAEPQRCFGILAGAVILLANFFTACGMFPVGCMAALSTVLLFAIFIIEIYRKKETPAGNIASTIMGVLYIALPLSLLCHIAVQPSAETHAGTYLPWRILCYIFIIWANDVGAYLVGVAFGRHRLIERISPKKSWEGFFGGVVAAVIVGVLSGYLLTQGSPEGMLFWGGLAVVAAVSGVFGDLVESLFKRSAGVKDSGAIMPGHGGFLDRFDALLLSTPFVFAYFTIFALLNS